MSASNRLTKAELEAVIGVAGDALAAETLSTEADPEGAIDAFERGMEKLRRQLASRTPQPKPVDEEKEFWRQESNLNAGTRLRWGVKS